MASVRAYLEAEKSANTRKGYTADWADFTTWCGQVSEDPLPALPLTVARYLAHLADIGRKTATIERRVAAIRSAHKAANHEPPTNSEGVKATMRGIRRTIRSKQTRKKPTTSGVLARVLEHLPPTTAGLRDRAILLVGFAAALRRSELVAIQLEDIERRASGVLIHLGQSKSDQDGKGTALTVPNGKKLRPIDALDAWIAAAKIISGPVFREVDRHGRVGAAGLSGRSIARIVKRAVKAAGLDDAAFSGHSMRAGFITSALDAGEDPLKLKKHSRHAKLDTLSIYDRRENELEDHVGGDFL
ncbi:site-specific integrase [Bradyrhizobium sp. 4]|nr:MULTISPECIES: site-specific integrase [unclassified Bradyrhizobium]MCK1402044.1 site-specific integrase [Bradyrhizobium sp. 39]MCK1751236.1 site-specific integrase [Bradyrhizobium sp. 135]UPJ38794.1 site-specific integrase [Bradyrhizobium sp. 4]